jgi:hypothetical protein
MDIVYVAPLLCVAASTQACQTVSSTGTSFTVCIGTSFRPWLLSARLRVRAPEGRFGLMGCYRRGELLLFRSPDPPMSRSPDLVPPPPVFKVVLQTKHFRNSTLGRPLRGPRVALGWPKGDPGVTQSQTQSQSGRGSQRIHRVPSTNQVPAFRLIANCYLQFFQ